MLKGENVNHLLDAAMTYGINAFDTARGYGAAENSLEQWMKDRNNRERDIRITKYLGQIFFEKRSGIFVLIVIVNIIGCSRYG